MLFTESLAPSHHQRNALITTPLSLAFSFHFSFCWGGWCVRVSVGCYVLPLSLSLSLSLCLPSLSVSPLSPVGRWTRDRPSRGQNSIETLAHVNYKKEKCHASIAGVDSFSSYRSLK